MKKDLVIIDLYPSTIISQEVLKECILRLNDTFDIALSTHYPVNRDIQDLVQYYIFDSFNELIDIDDSYVVWFKNSEFHLQIKNIKNYSYAAYSTVLNAVNLLHKKYDYFYHINGDVLIHEEDIKKLLHLKTLTLNNNKKCLFFREFENVFDAQVLKPGVLDAQLFFSSTKFFIEKLAVVSSKQQFVEYNRTFINPYVPNLLESFYAERVDNWSQNEAYLLEEKLENYLNKSEIDALNTFNGTSQKRKTYQIYLVKHNISNKIFFVYITNSIDGNKQPLDVKIDDTRFVISNQIYSYYKEVVPNKDYIKMEIEGTVSTYSVKEVLDNHETYIEFY